MASANAGIPRYRLVAIARALVDEDAEVDERRVRLTPELSQYLGSAEYLPADLLTTIRDFLSGEGQSNTVSVEVALAERFREWFTVRLAQVGFDAEYNLSPEGVYLEELIDRFAG